MFLEINPLSVVSFAIIFSHSEGSLFTLLLGFFIVQKFSSLIRSRLFTFVFISIALGGVSLGREDPLGKGMATHSSIVAWRIP